MPPFKPQTRLGRVACILAVAFVAWFLANMVLFWLSLAELTTGATRPLVIGLSWLGMACGVATAVTALVAIAARHERSVAVYLCLVPGLFAALFLLAEFLVPH